MLSTTKVTNLSVSGMHCSSCALIIERYLKKAGGVVGAHVNLPNETAVVTHDISVSPNQVIKIIEKAGYKAHLTDLTNPNDGIANRAGEEKAALIKLIASALLATPLAYFMLMGSAAMGYFGVISLILATPIQLILGASFYKGMLSNIRAKMFGMDSLIAIGTSTAYIYSLYLYLNFVLVNPGGEFPQLYFETSAFLITFVLLGKWLETKSKHKTSAALSNLVGLQVKTVTVLVNGQTVETPVELLKLGDIFLAKPGEKIATDGIIVAGNSFVDESMITGESMPIYKTIGNKVVGATLNQGGALTVKVERIGSETMLAQIIKLVQEAQGSKAPIQDFADKVSAVFVPVVLVVALVTFAYWFFIGGSEFSAALHYFIAVIVISCPCALGLATPTALVTGIGLGAKNGIIIKGGQAIEETNKINAIVFDKTGTITQGKPQVSGVIDFGTSEQNLLQIAGSIERYSEHPIAACIVAEAGNRNIPLLEITDFQSDTGQGASATISGERYFVGSQKYVESVVGTYIRQGDDKIIGTQVFLASKKAVLGTIYVRDQIKVSSKKAVELLKKSYELYMITGDNEFTAQKVASEVGITNVLAQVLPGDKANQIKILQRQGKKVAMVGDGINDSPALTQADIGIAMGNGTDISIESAGIVLLKDDLTDVGKALAIGKATLSKIKQNMFWALFYNMAGIPIAAGALSSFGFTLRPEIAGLAMAFSSVSVVLNSLTLNKLSLVQSSTLNTRL
jgi:Cu+-exporting ATPase